MKKVLIMLCVFLMANVAIAQSIVGSAHDFSNNGWNTSGEICITCHTPHNADVSVLNAPLWNHEVTTAVYTLYSSTTLDASDMGQPDGPSKLCLSCHDGTVAIDNFGGKTDGTAFASGNNLIGTNLSDDHPVSFTYDIALVGLDDGLYDPSTSNSGMGGTIDADMLFDNKLECSSCHDVHNGSGMDNLLIKSNASSDMCLTCHIK